MDRFGPGNQVGSSGDESRITRSSHGPDRHYPVWQRRALAHWSELERAAGEQLFVEAGVVWLANEAQTFEGESLVSLTELGIPVERWSQDDLAARVPVMDPEGVPWALYEPEAGALAARRSVVATIAAFEAAGGSDRRRPRRGAFDPGRRPGARAARERRLARGRRVRVRLRPAGCPSSFPDALGSLITPHRQDVVHFAVPEGDARLSRRALPVWIDFERSFYGFPSFDGVASEGLPRLARTGRAARRLGARGRRLDGRRVAARSCAGAFPGLAEQPVVKSWTCFYEVTPDAHFVIDRHPTLADTWIAGGGTGHAFKHGPVIGEYLARAGHRRPRDRSRARAARRPLRDPPARGPPELPDQRSHAGEHRHRLTTRSRVSPPGSRLHSGVAATRRPRWP